MQFWTKKMGMLGLQVLKSIWYGDRVNLQVNCFTIRQCLCVSFFFFGWEVEQPQENRKNDQWPRTNKRIALQQKSQKKNRDFDNTYTDLEADLIDNLVLPIDST